MRSSLRDWCEETGVRREIAEAALAHAVKNKVEAVYARSDLLQSRRKVMEWWNEYLAKGVRAQGLGRSYRRWNNETQGGGHPNAGRRVLVRRGSDDVCSRQKTA